MLKAYLDVKDVTSDDEKTAFAATCLEGNALVWWCSVDVAGTFAQQAATFEDRCEALSNQFRSVEHELKLHRRLHELKQTKSVQ